MNDNQTAGQARHLRLVSFLLNFSGCVAVMTVILWILKVPSGVECWRCVIAGLLFIPLQKFLSAAITR